MTTKYRLYCQRTPSPNPLRLTGYKIPSIQPTPPVGNWLQILVILPAFLAGNSLQNIEYCPIPLWVTGFKIPKMLPASPMGLAKNIEYVATSACR